MYATLQGQDDFTNHMHVDARITQQSSDLKSEISRDRASSTVAAHGKCSCEYRIIDWAPPERYRWVGLNGGNASGNYIQWHLLVEDPWVREASTWSRNWQNSLSVQPTILHWSSRLQDVSACLFEWRWGGEGFTPFSLLRTDERRVRCSQSVAFQAESHVNAPWSEPSQAYSSDLQAHRGARFNDQKQKWMSHLVVRPKFAPRTVLDNPSYVKDDTMFLKCKIDATTLSMNIWMSTCYLQNCFNMHSKILVFLHPFIFPTCRNCFYAYSTQYTLICVILSFVPRVLSHLKKSHQHI